MRFVYTAIAITIATAPAGATATVGSGRVAVQKQRIGIDVVHIPGTAPDTATVKFEIHPYSPGPLVEDDKGLATDLLTDGGRAVRNGMSVGLAVARQKLIGRRGTLRISVRLDVYDIEYDGSYTNGSRVLLGTWRIMGGTGAYSGLRGGGRYAGIVPPTGRTAEHEEGWVTR